MNEPAIYQELDLKIERLIMSCKLTSPALETAAIEASKKAARKLIDSGEFTAEEVLKQIKEIP